MKIFKNLPKTIGLSGLARSGKDTFANFLENTLSQNEIKINRISFACALRESLDSLVKESLGFSSFTEVSREKEIIRPLLVCFGTQIMRNQNPNHWINKLSGKIKDDSVNIITDVRFPNECKWIQDDLGGSIIHITRNGFETPPNQDERINNPVIKKNSDFKFKWDTISQSNSESYDQSINSILYSILNETRITVGLKFNQQHQKR
jgi:hypothetical protein